MLSFLSPLLLIGAISAAIPLILHLSRSRRTKKMRFSTTRFFTDQFLRSYRMSRLKELLLLACRMALCALLAVAFAQPLLMPQGTAFLGGGSRSVVLVVDNSASMAYKEDGRTQIQRARAAAKTLVDSLNPGDTVSVVLSGRRAAGPQVLCENKPHSELGDVLQIVEQLSVSTLGADLTEAIVRAEEIAQSSTAASKEVYVLSDLQDSGWDVDNERLRSRKDSDVLFFLVQLRPKEVSNVSVRAVQYTTSRPMAGIPFAIRPVVKTQGKAGNKTVSLYVYNKEGKPERVAERPLEQRRNGGWSAPRFYHVFPRGGWHSGYVEVQDDNLPLDNRRYFALQVLDSVRVLAINGARSEVKDDIDRNPVFFLRAALHAANFRAEGGKEAVHVDVDYPGSLERLDLAKYPLVMLANVARLSARAVEKLEGYVDRGGSLMVFLGDNVDAGFYNKTLAAATRPNGGLLPAELVQERGNTDLAGKTGDASYAAVGSLAYRHAVLAPFEDPKNGNLAGVTFKALWEMRPDPDKASVLMTARVLPGKTGGGKAPAAGQHLPLLCEKQYGKGRVLLFASTCNRGRTNFPTSSTFLPWTHQLVCYLAQPQIGRQGFLNTGEAVPLPVALTEGLPPVKVKKPDGKSGHATAGSDPEQPLEFTDTEQAGIYRFFPDDKERTNLLAINLDAYESNLTYLDDVLLAQYDGDDSANRTRRVEAGFKTLLPNRPLVSYVDDPDQLGEVSASARRGVRLWDVFLWVVLALVLFEPWLANQISARHYATPRDLPQEAAPRAGRWGRVPGVEKAANPQEVSS